MPKKYFTALCLIILACAFMGFSAHSIAAELAEVPDAIESPAEDGMELSLNGAAPDERRAATIEMTADQKDLKNFIPLLNHTYQNSPELEAARKAFQADIEQIAQALAGWRPTVQGTANVTDFDLRAELGIPASFDGGTERAYGITLSQPIYRGGQTANDVEAAEAAINASRYNLRSIEQQVFNSAVIAYIDVVQARSTLKLQEGNQALLQRQFEATSERFEVGELTRTDVSQAESRLARAESQVIDANGQLRAVEATYQRITGLQPPQALLFPAAQIQLPKTLDLALESGKKQSPVLKRAEFSWKNAEAAADSQFGTLLPQLSFDAGWSRAFDPGGSFTDVIRTQSFGLTATVPLYSAGADRSRYRQAKKTTESLKYQIDDTLRQVEESIVRNWELWESAKAEITSREAQLRAAEIAREGVQQETLLGTRSVLDSLDADQELLDAQVALVTAQRNEVAARFNLAEALGLLQPDLLNLPPVFDERAYEQKVRSILYSFVTWD